VTPARLRPWWPAVLLAVAGLGVLYADALRAGFLCDDYLFIEQARRPLAETLSHLGALGNYYRPLSRQLYFEALVPFAAHRPLVFHLVDAALLAGAIALLVDLLRGVAPRTGVLAGVLWFALIPFQRVNLIWVSCSQDLLALVLSLAAFALVRRGHDRWACLAYLGAIASKEIAFPLPLLFVAWLALGLPARGAPSRRPADLARRFAPFAVIAGAWLAVQLIVRTRDHAADPAGLHFGAAAFVAALVHGLQSLLGLDHPRGFVRGLMENGPALLPLVLLAALAWWIDDAPRGETSEPAPPIATRRVLLFAIGWIVLFTLPVGPVAHTWSAYYYTLAAVGGTMIVAVLLRRLDRWGWVALTAGLLWWHAGVSAAPVTPVPDRIWSWTTHLNAAYFERAAALSERLARGLERSDPRPEHGTRFFFATLPEMAAFQMGNGALVRELYGDPTLASYFYSQFAESTAAGHPCRFLYWDGVEFQELYRGSASPWFQVGSDLMLFGRPAGAAYAFRRGLAEGEGRTDHLYWLGWAELWTGHRAAAEEAWKAFGAVDDTAAYHAHLFAANGALEARDSTTARRRLFDAVHAGIGRPEAHAALGRLLIRRQIKYGLLELQVASFLDPRDMNARHRLAIGLVEVRLDEPAAREMAAIRRLDPAWRRDAALVAAARQLELRTMITD
jgi:hypothetical protein